MIDSNICPLKTPNGISYIMMGDLTPRAQQALALSKELQLS